MADADITVRAHVVRAIRWQMENGLTGVNISTLSETEHTDTATGYAIGKIGGRVEIWSDFERGAGVYELSLAVDMARSRPAMRCVGAKWVGPLPIRVEDSGTDKSKQ